MLFICSSVRVVVLGFSCSSSCFSSALDVSALPLLPQETKTVRLKKMIAIIKNFLIV